MAMDFPAAVERPVVMDGPPRHRAPRAAERGIRAHLAAPVVPQPDRQAAEDSISADLARWYRTPPPGQMREGNHTDAWAAFRDPASPTACAKTTEPACAPTPLTHEEADRAAGRKITCPVPPLVSADDDLDIHGAPRGNPCRQGVPPVPRAPKNQPPTLSARPGQL